jgi:transcriptional regulator with XRE-family HTH domain
MVSDQGPTVLSALLRSELVRLRKEQDLTQEAVAADLEWSPSKLIRVEGGQSKITKVDLDALLTKYGVTSESHRERLQALNRAARERAWWDEYRDDVTAAYLSYVGFEAGASSIRQCQIAFMPGLLQIPEYGQVVTGVRVADPARVDAIVDFRRQRQEKLAQRSAPPRQYFVLDEAVIRRRVGSKKNRAIMPNQLRAVADRAELDRLVTVRVIPFEVGAHAGLIEPFTILEFEGGLPAVLFLDTDREAFTMISGESNEAMVAKYERDFDKLLEDALSAEDSIKVMRSLAEEMSGT